MPKNWNSYLRNETNKTELFQYLSGVIAKSVFDEGKVVITTYDKNILHNPCADDPVIHTEYPLCPCNHQEFDTRVMLHAAMQYHKDTSAYSSLLMTVTLLS